MNDRLCDHVSRAYFICLLLCLLSPYRYVCHMPVCLFILSLSVFVVAVYLCVCLSFASVCLCLCLVFVCPSVCRLPSDSATEERLVNRVLVRTRLISNRQVKYLYKNTFCLKLEMLRHQYSNCWRADRRVPFEPKKLEISRA
jgi:hypothetical protein